jgi:hypothetical protein
MSGEQDAIPPSDTGERRVREVKLRVPAQLQEGWLAFQNGKERRRLVPIPNDWTTIDDSALVALLEQAERITGAP